MVVSDHITEQRLLLQNRSRCHINHFCVHLTSELAGVDDQKVMACEVTAEEDGKALEI